MSLASVLIIGCATVAHAVLSRHLASPWFLPDLVLVGMVAGILLDSQQPAMPIISAALCAMTLTVSTPWQTVLAYGTAGWMVQQLASRIDLAAPSRPCILLGVAETTCLGFLLLTTHVRPLELVFLSGLRVGLTAASFPLVQWLVDGVGRKP